MLTTESHPSFQGPNCAKAFTDGSPHQIPQRTTTSNVLLITKKLRLGSFKAASFRSGSQQDRFFGFMENVCPVLFPIDSSNTTSYYSWVGQERSVVRRLLIVLSEMTDVSSQFLGDPRYRIHLQERKGDHGVLLF